MGAHHLYFYQNTSQKTLIRVKKWFLEYECVSHLIKESPHLTKIDNRYRTTFKTHRIAGV